MRSGRFADLRAPSRVLPTARRRRVLPPATNVLRPVRYNHDHVGPPGALGSYRYGSGHDRGGV